MEDSQKPFLGGGPYKSMRIYNIYIYIIISYIYIYVYTHQYVAGATCSFAIYFPGGRLNRFSFRILNLEHPSLLVPVLTIWLLHGTHYSWQSSTIHCPCALHRWEMGTDLSQNCEHPFRKMHLTAGNQYLFACQTGHKSIGKRCSPNNVSLHIGKKVSLIPMGRDHWETLCLWVANVLAEANSDVDSMCYRI